MAEDDGGRAKKRRKVDETSTTAARNDAVQYHCDYCQKDISNCLRISCATCPEFDLCVECFSVGVELKGHKNDHDFRIIDNMHFPFLSEDWGADEELLLLEGLEINGYGNWEDVAEHITTKTKKEVEEHYSKYYRNAPAWPSVDLSRLLSTRADVMRLNALPYRNEPVTTTESNSKTKKNQPKFQPSHPVRPELSNLMPMRGEFEIEWDNDAENPIKDLEVDANDVEEEKAIKVKLFQLYNQRVEEREEKRRFVLERGLHDVKKMSAIEKKRTKDEKEIYSKTRKFATLMSQAEWDDYVKNLLAERILRAKISELQVMRQNGVRSLVDGELYRKEMKKREMDKNKWRSSTRSRGWEAAAPPPISDKKGTKGLAASVALGVAGLSAGGSSSSWNLALQPGYELLSEVERAVCEGVRISPMTYLNAKEALIREALALGGALNIEQAKAALPKIDAQKIQKLFDFMVECNYIIRAAAPSASGVGMIGGGPSHMGGMGGGIIMGGQQRSLPHQQHMGHPVPHMHHQQPLISTSSGPGRLVISRAPAPGISPIPGVGRPGMH